MASHTSGAIALRPSGNAQRSYYFLNLHFGKRIIRNNWTVLPMPNEVINTIHQLAAACNKYKGIGQYRNYRSGRWYVQHKQYGKYMSRRRRSGR